MANTRIPQLTPAISLSGNEWVELAVPLGGDVWESRRIQTSVIGALGLTPTGVSAGTYGNANNVPQFTVGIDGRLTFAGNIPLASGGTVTSVGLAAPADFDVTGSPVTATGTLTLDWVTSPTGTGAMVRQVAAALITPDLGTPTAAVLTNATGLPIATGVAGLGAGIAAFLAAPSSANLAAAVTDETGSGALVFGTSPTLVTPNIGTPSAAVLTNATGLPIITGTTGTLSATRGGTGLSSYTLGDLIYASAANVLGAVPIGGAGQVLAVNPGGNGYEFITVGGTGTVTSVDFAAPADFSVAGNPITAAGTITLDWTIPPTGTGAVVRATSPSLVTPDLGTPSAAILTNATGLPVATGIAGLGAGVATWLATPTSANLATLIVDETGTGDLVFSISPVLTTPDLGTPSAVDLANAVNLPVATGLSGLGSGVAAWLATPSSANLAAAVTGETGSGALVFATSPTLVTPTLGVATASSLVVTSATLPTTNGMYLPAASTLGWAINNAAEMQLTAAALSPAVSDGNALGTAALMWSDLFLASGAVINFNNGNVVLTHSTGVVEVTTGDLRVTTAGTNAASAVTNAGTQTLTNKRVTPRVTTIASSATPTINTDTWDAVSITALAVAITSMTTNLSGTPTNFQKLIIRLKDNGSARAITWGASYADMGAALPTTTVAGKVTTVGLIYDSVAAVWGCVAVVTQP